MISDNERMRQELADSQERSISMEGQLKQKDLDLEATFSELEERESRLQNASQVIKSLQRHWQTTKDDLGALQHQFEVLSADRCAVSIQSRLISF